MHYIHDWKTLNILEMVHITNKNPHLSKISPKYKEVQYLPKQLKNRNKRCKKYVYVCEVVYVQLRVGEGVQGCCLRPKIK